MSVFITNAFDQLFPFFSFLIMFILMGFIDYFYKQLGIDTKEEMREKKFTLTPSRHAFSIWGLIFGGLFVFLLLNCFNRFTDTFDPLWTGISFLFMISWLASFSVKFYFLSSISLLCSVISSFEVILQIPTKHDFMSFGSGYIVGIFFGWLITAALLNICIFIQQTLLGGKDNTYLNIMFIFSLFIIHIAISTLLYVETLTMCWPASLVLLWSVNWVLFKKEGQEQWIYLLLYGFSCLILIFSIIRVFTQFEIFEFTTKLDIFI